MNAQIAHIDRPAPRHVRVSGPRLTFTYERCQHAHCVVTAAGAGSICGEPACPSCGSGGANLTSTRPRTRPAALELHCTCGCFFISERPRTSSLALVSPPHDAR